MRKRSYFKNKRPRGPGSERTAAGSLVLDGIYRVGKGGFYRLVTDGN